MVERFSSQVQSRVSVRAGARGVFPALAPLPRLRHASCGRVRGRARVPRDLHNAYRRPGFDFHRVKLKLNPGLSLEHCNPGTVTGCSRENACDVGATALRAAGAVRVACAGAAIGCATLESKSKRWARDAGRCGTFLPLSP